MLHHVIFDQLQQIRLSDTRHVTNEKNELRTLYLPKIIPQELPILQH